MPYRIEVSPNARASCKGGKPCKGTKIEKGQVRFATRVKIQDKESWAYRHWGCVTPKIFQNMKNEIETPEDLDGYEELPEEFQEKIREAWKEGKVADADVPESAKKPADGEEGEDSPKKKAPRKTKAKKTYNEDDGSAVDEEEEPKPKKKAPAKRKKAKKAESDEDEESQEEVMPTKKARGGGRGGRAAKAAEEDDE